MRIAMKHGRTWVSAGILVAAVVGLQASGPVRPAGTQPAGEPGPWIAAPNEGCVPLTMHTPDFTAAIPRTRGAERPVPAIADRDMPHNFNPMQTPAQASRPRGGADSEKSGDGEQGRLDSWLLPEGGGSSEDSGWGWLADSVSEDQASEAAGAAELLRGALLNEAAEWLQQQRMEIIGPSRMDMDFSRGEGGMDDGLFELERSAPREAPGAEGGGENGWAMPSWR